MSVARPRAGEEVAHGPRVLLRIAGRWEHCERWALLAEDWRAQARKPAGRVRPERHPRPARR